jgi:diaminopimelate epimerase
MSIPLPQGRPFIKMHGLGNDFVVLDGRALPLALDAAAARKIADRHTGVGCDQIVVLEKPTREGADIAVRFLNADGAEISTCGNGSRCAAWLIMGETGGNRLLVETKAGLVEAVRTGEWSVTVDMGPPRLAWNEIPLSRRADTLHLPVAADQVSDPVGVSMGNPHAVFFVKDVAAVDLTAIGPRLEHDPLFPERANIELIQVIDSGHLRMRVWERGAGITMACGSGACAALVAAVRRELTGRRAIVTLDGGDLEIEWKAGEGTNPGHVIMSGPVAMVYSGRLESALLP